MVSEYPIQWDETWDAAFNPDFVMPTPHQQDYLRRMCFWHTSAMASIADVLIHYWGMRQIEFNDDWEVWRHPLWLYKNYCEIFDLDADAWDSEFDAEFWQSRIRQFAMS